jgi:outer membrane PBP1 activator LpoA protein
MNSRQRITTLLKEWLELTQLECHALQVDRWSDVSRIQKSKAALQEPLTAAIEQWKAESPVEAGSNPCHYEINRLLDLESRNSELLAVRKREVREKMHLLEQALYDLRNTRSRFAQTSEAA